MKKPTSKVAQNSSNPLFFLTALTAQTAQTEEFLFQNVAYWLTVYRTGTSCIVAWSQKFQIPSNKVLVIGNKSLITIFTVLIDFDSFCLWLALKTLKFHHQYLDFLHSPYHSCCLYFPTFTYATSNIVDLFKESEIL